MCIWALGNISADHYKFRDFIIETGAIEMISDILDNAAPGSSLILNASFTLKYLCGGEPKPIFGKIRRAIKSIIEVVKKNDSQEILVEACCMLANCRHEIHKEERIQILYDQELIQRLLEIIGSHETTN